MATDAKGKKIYYGIHLDTTQLKRDAQQASQSIRGIGDKTVAEGARLDAAFRRAGKALGVAFGGRELIQFGKQIVTVRGEFQQLEAAFTTMLGSKSKADELMAKTIDFAAKTPFDLQGVAQGTKQLLAYGSEAENVTDELKMLGNIAAGLSMPLNDLVYLYGTTRTQGRMYTMDLRQFMGRGIPLAEELAKQFGVTKDKVSELVSEGKVGFDDMNKALQSMTSEGGKFYNLMEEQSKTITGKISNLGDAVQQMFNKLGKSSEGFINGAIDSASYLVENYEKVGKVVLDLVAVYGSYKAAVIAVNALSKTITTIKHTEEAASLYQLLTAEQQAQISKQGLSKSSAEYYALVKAETAANVQATQSTLVKARADVKAASESVVARRAEYVAAKQLEKQRLAELMSIGTTGSAKQVEAAQRKLSAAETQRESAAIAFQSATRDFNTKKTVVATAARTANTTASAMNTAAETANATATGFLSVAKTRLTAVTAKLNAVIKANPYVLAAAAVAALSFGIYKLITAKSAEEKANEKVNKTLEDYKTKLGETKSKAEELHGVMTDDVSTAYQKEKAYRDLIAAYPELLKNYSAEEIKLMSIVELNKQLGRINDDRSEANVRAKYNETLEKIRLLKAEAKEVSQNGSAAGLGAALAGGDGWEKESFALKQAKIELQKYGDELKEIEDIRKQAEYDNAPTEVKIATLDKNIAEFDSQIAVLEQKIKDAKNKIGGVGFTPFTESEDYLNQQISLINAQKNEANGKKDALTNPEGKELTDEEKKAIAEKQKALREAVVSVELAVEKARIDAMQEGTAKRLAQLEFDHKQALATIDKEKAELEAKYRELGKLIPDSVAEGFKSRVGSENARYYSALLPNDDMSAQEEENQINDDFEASLRKRKESMNAYLAEYGDYEQQRLAITEQYADKIAQAELDGDTWLVKSLGKERDSYFHDLEKKYGAIYQRIFGDVSKKTRKQISEAINLARKALEDPKLSIEQVKELKDQIDALEDGQQSMYSQSYDTSWENIFRNYSKLIDYRERAAKAGDTKESEYYKGLEEKSKEKLRNNLMGVGVDTFVSGLSKSAELMQEIADLSGDIELSDTADKLNALSQNFSSAGQGAASGGWIGAIVGGATDMIAQTIDATQQSKLAAIELENFYTNFANNLKVLALQVDEDDYESIFGISTLRMGQEAYKNAQKSLEEYNAYVTKVAEVSASKKITSNLGTAIFSGLGIGAGKKTSELWKQQVDAVINGYSELEALSVKTTNKSGWAKFWGGQDKYTSLKDFAPELWDSEGAFDTEKAKVFLEAVTDKQITSAQREQIQNAIDLKDAYDESMNAINEQLSNFLGNMATDMADSIWDAVVGGGEDAWKEWQDIGANAIASIGKQMLEELIMDSYLNSFQQRLQGAYSTDNPADAIADITSEIVNGFPEVFQSATDAAIAYKNKMESEGIDFSSGSSRSASAKGIATESQDSIDYNNGQLTLGNNTLSDIKGLHALQLEQVGSIRSTMDDFKIQNAAMLQEIMGIRRNTDVLPDMKKATDDIRREIQQINLQGVQIQR